MRSIEIGDRVGIAAAVVCAVHCVAAPVLAASLQVAGAFASERTELRFLTASLLISGMTVMASCVRGRGRRSSVGAFVLGACLLLATRGGFAATEAIEPPLVVSGAGLIVAAHLINLFGCRCDTEGPTCTAID